MEARALHQQDDGGGPVYSTMARLQPAQYLDLLLTAHAAEDAFDPIPEDTDEDE